MTLAIAAFLASTRRLRCRFLVSAKRRLSVRVPASARALTTRLQPMSRKKRKKRKGPRKTRTKKDKRPKDKKEKRRRDKDKRADEDALA